MYMGPIVAAKPSSSPLARVLMGIPTLMLAAVLLLPWLAAMVMAAGLMLGLRVLPGAPRALMARSIMPAPSRSVADRIRLTGRR